MIILIIQLLNGIKSKNKKTFYGGIHDSILVANDNE